ncbi:hypothetical protein REH81_27525, partial [Vibrio rotiferianus]
MKKKAIIIKYCKENLKIKVGSNYVEFDINKDVDIDNIRNKFNDNIRELYDINHDNLDFHLSRLAERNTLVNNLFQDVCFIELISQISEKNENVTVFTGNTSIYLHFKNIAKVSFEDIILFSRKVHFERVISKVKSIKTLMNELLLKIKYGRRKPIPPSNSTIIQTWISDSSVNNEILDPYFQKLKDNLKRRGVNLFTLINFYNISNHKKTISTIRRHDSEYILHFDHLSFFDYIKFIRIILIRHPIKTHDTFN